jgi:hypothetical protein
MPAARADVKAPRKTQRMDKVSGWADAAGVVTSALCLLHCLAMPLLLAALPALGWAGDDRLHAALVGVALLAALVSLGPGYVKHRRAAVPLIGGAGLACLGAAVFLVGPRYGEAGETALTVAGAVLLCIAHLRNRACCHRCETAPPHRREPQLKESRTNAYPMMTERE